MDITDVKELEQSLGDARELAEAILSTIPEPLLMLDTQMKVVSANQLFYATFNLKPEETKDRLVYTLANSQWDIPELHQLLDEIIPKKTIIENFKMKLNLPQVGTQSILLNARKIESKAGSDLILVAFENVAQQAS
jgi:PAS domain-containing protein